jgi:hypothetical protein
VAARIAWALNLDAELELGGGAGYTPTRRVKVAMKAHIETLASSLLGPDDIVVDEDSTALVARGLLGRAYCPTPRALALLRRAGTELEPHPSLSVLRYVSSRAFASSLGTTLPGAAFVTDAEEACRKIESSPQLGRFWRIKYAFGMTGRNQRVVPAVPLSERDLDFVTIGIAQGGVQIEPNLAIEEEYARHGWIGVEGDVRVGELVRQRSDIRGAWVSTQRIDERSEALDATRARMGEEVRYVASALMAAGYFGPFGVDAFSYRDDADALRFQPRSEINARYSMGFAAGFGLRSSRPR